jgi:dephospho-CoA kinase
VAGRPLRVALTGGLASGKSFCLAAFARLGAPVIDADTLARDVVEPGTPGLGRVVRRFGPQVLGPDGRLDRGALAAIVFANDDARRDLEGIVHPEVYGAIARWFDSLSSAPAGIAEIPLLYETHHAEDFDCVVVAACRREVQAQRARARGMSDLEIDRRLAAQLPLDDKRRRADYVIDTDGTPAQTERQVTEIWNRFGADRIG